MSRKGRRRRADLSWLAFDARRIAQRLSGAKMCFGAPVHVGERTVIPVASLRTLGGLGFGRSPTPPPGPPAPLVPPIPSAEVSRPAKKPPPPPPPADGENLGGGGGGMLNARPLGFIDIGPEGATYRPIPSSRSRAALTGAAVAGLWVGTHLLRARRSPRARTSKQRGAAALPWPLR